MDAPERHGRSTSASGNRQPFPPVQPDSIIACSQCSEEFCNTIGHKRSFTHATEVHWAIQRYRNSSGCCDDLVLHLFGPLASDARVAPCCASRHISTATLPVITGLNCSYVSPSASAPSSGYLSKSQRERLRAVTFHRFSRVRRPLRAATICFKLEGRDGAIGQAAASCLANCRAHSMKS
jgi:hypothetical protein